MRSMRSSTKNTDRQERCSSDYYFRASVAVRSCFMSISSFDTLQYVLWWVRGPGLYEPPMTTPYGSAATIKNSCQATPRQSTSVSAGGRAARALGRLVPRSLFSQVTPIIVTRRPAFARQPTSTVTRRNVAGISVVFGCRLWFWLSNSFTSSSRSACARPSLAAASKAFMVGP
jgi:hypothetical protein